MTSLTQLSRAVAVVAAITLISLYIYAHLAYRLNKDEKSLIEIVIELEKLGYEPLLELSFDNGIWKVEACKKGIAQELLVHPKTDKVIVNYRVEERTKSPMGSKRL